MSNALPLSTPLETGRTGAFTTGFVGGGGRSSFDLTTGSPPLLAEATMFGNPSMRFPDEAAGAPEAVGSAGTLLGRLTSGVTVLATAFGFGVTAFAGTAAAGVTAEAAGLWLTILAEMTFAVTGALALVGRGAAAAVWSFLAVASSR